MVAQRDLVLVSFCFVGAFSSACLDPDARKHDSAEVDTDADADADADTDTDTDTGPLDADGDGWTVAGGDCDDGLAEVHPGAEEVCNNGLDDDCDGDPEDCALPASASLGDIEIRWSGAAGEWAGWDLDGAGDVDGDGFADAVIGGGAVYLIPGGPLPAGGSLAAAISYTQPTGTGRNDELGRAVAGLGDFDGDGFDDIAGGAPDWWNGEDSVGCAYLFLGSADPEGGTADDIAVRYEGSGSESQQVGDALAGVGDVNGDGLADMLVGAPHWGPSPTPDRGAAYLVLGTRSPGGGALDTVALRFEGESDQQAGISLAGAGDVNGDGLADFLVGAPYERNATGAAHLILGSTAPSGGVLSSADARFWSDTAGDMAGYGLSGAGDANGDGYADILMGLHGTERPGAAVLFLGASTMVGRNIEAADARFDGSGQEQAGIGVAGPGDMNRDGYDDLLIGAGLNNDAGTWAGAAYLVLGAPELSGRALAEAETKLTGESSNDHAGYAVAGASDMNADGTPDLLVGAFGRDAYAGAAYLVLGVAE
ncbi:MAG: MopE-related protein [Pseudomonadota bacterium]